MKFIFPTQMEAAQFVAACPDAEVIICGVGMAAVAATMVDVCRNAKSGEMIVLAGIAGCYPGSNLALNEVVEVVSEQIEELPKRFGQCYKNQANFNLRQVSSNTVNRSDFEGATSDIENMEGATFFSTCEKFDVHYSEVRAISNVVGDPFEKWSIDTAILALTDSLLEIYKDYNMKLYISPCPNDTFMFDAIINRRIDLQGLEFEVEYYDIEELNRRAMLGEAHFSKISCAILQSIKSEYVISESGAALGRGNGPLFVRRKGDTSPINTVAVPGFNTTANLLMERLFPQYTDRKAMLFSDIAAAVESGEVDAGVLIHEGRFVYEQRNLELVADLGLEWDRRTSLPLPLGGIVMRRDIPATIHLTFEKLLRNSIQYAFENPNVSREFIKQHAQELSDDVIDQHIALFVNEYSLSLGDEGHLALETLLR